VTQFPANVSAADSDPSADAAVQVLQLAVRVHVAGGDPVALRATLKACSEWLGCTGVLGLLADGHPLDPDALESLAGRVTHCAAYGTDACGGGFGDPIRRRRARCAALAPHLHEAARAARNALQAMFFDQLPPIWILDRSGRVQNSNTPAKSITGADEPLAVVDGLLVPAVPGGVAHLRHTLTDLDHETRFSWPEQHGGETTLLLRPLPGGAGIAATLLREPPTAGQLAPLLAQRLKLTLRQSDLAAHLLVGQTLSDAARAMGISRHTANEHLVGLLKRVGAPDRKALVVTLRRAVTC
jgi:DNA-binding CsgD family transcriptional regulator